MKPYYDEDGITIYHGEACALLAELPPASVDILMTDPPYSSGGMFRGDRSGDPLSKYGGRVRPILPSTPNRSVEYGTFGGDTRDQRSFIQWVSAWSWGALRVTRPGGHAFVFSDWRQLPSATDAVQLGGWSWRGVLVWDKTQAAAIPQRGRFRQHIEFVVWASHGPFELSEVVAPSAVITVSNVSGAERQHITQKPVEVMQHLLQVVPTQNRLTVLDPFMGSGSTLVAARKMGHNAIGIEVEERYCQIAVERLAQGVLAL